MAENNWQAPLLVGPIKIQRFKFTLQKLPVQVNQRIQCNTLSSRRAISIITEKTQKLINVLSGQRFRVPILVKPDEPLYPIDIGFLCLVGMTLITEIYSNPVNKAFRSRRYAVTNVFHERQLQARLYICTVGEILEISSLFFRGQAGKVSKDCF